MSRRHILVLSLALCLVTGGRAADCPASARELPADALYGDWAARFDGAPGAVSVTLARHPDYAGVHGTITRIGADSTTSVAQLAGDVDDEGTLSLDESLDGRTISGVWTGELQAASCGREFRGTWRDAADDSTHPFVLNKTGSPK